MNIITVDIESYYSQEFSLTKLTTEEYVRDDRFQVIGVGIKNNEEETTWHTGTHAEIAEVFAQYNWEDSLVLAHNTAFDGAILSWRFGIRPKGWLDTLSMARAIHGISVGGSLAKLAKHYGAGEKGTEVVNALGLRREEFPTAQLAQYGEYCKNDVNLCRFIFDLMMAKGFPVLELRVIDATLKMFVEPSLELDLPLLEQHLEDVKTRKEKLLEAAAADKDMLMSNDRFAELLQSLGVTPPKKISAKTGREAWAFAKTDEEFKALQEHADPRVQTLVAARLGNKTTLEETRTQRFINIAKRGLLPVPLKYYAAHTGRWGGEDKINLQNLPSRGQNAGKLKKAIRAPKGWVMIDSDSSQIEARTLAWLAGQEDLVEFFRKNNDEIAAGVKKQDMKFDPYKIMAAQIYGKGIDQITDPERFVGKTTILGAGYGMGADKFQAQLKTFNVDIPLDECKRIISVYRQTYEKIPELWAEAQHALEAMVLKRHASLGREGVLEFDSAECGFILPNGLPLRYAELRTELDAKGRTQYVYQTRMGWTKLYGGKVVENVCQALARCVIAEQMIKIGRRYKVALTVHDSIGILAPKDEATEAREYVESCMRWAPAWAAGLPLNCESGVAESYGDC